MRSARAIPARSDAPRLARQLVMANLIEAACTSTTVEVARLLVSELVTNALLHTSGEVITVEVEIDEPVCRVTVVDDDPTVPVVKRPRPEDEGGRGLHLVEDLATRWAVEPRADAPGKAIWFELLCA